MFFFFLLENQILKAHGPYRYRTWLKLCHSFDILLIWHSFNMDASIPMKEQSVGDSLAMFPIFSQALVKFPQTAHVSHHLYRIIWWQVLWLWCSGLINCPLATCMLLFIVNNCHTFKKKWEGGVSMCQRMKKINVKCIYIAIILDRLS